MTSKDKLPTEAQVNKIINNTGWLLLVQLMRDDRIRWGTYDSSISLWLSEICEIPLEFKSIELFRTEHDCTMYVATRGQSVAAEILDLAARDEEYRECLIAEQQKVD
jgi:hypothetical protein